MKSYKIDLTGRGKGIKSLNLEWKFSNDILHTKYYNENIFQQLYQV